MKKSFLVLLSSVGLLLTSSNAIASEEECARNLGLVKYALQEILAEQRAEDNKKSLEFANAKYDAQPHDPKRSAVMVQHSILGKGSPWRKVADGTDKKSAKFIVNHYHPSSTVKASTPEEIDAQRSNAIAGIIKHKKEKTEEESEAKPAAYETFKAEIVAAHALKFKEKYEEKSLEGPGKAPQGWFFG